MGSMESYGFHVILRLKSFQIQWNLLGPMRFLTIKSYQISLYPKCYGSMIQRVLIIKGEHYKVHLTLRGAVSNPVMPL